jgi:TrmH family RNA methyltransferase
MNNNRQTEKQSEAQQIKPYKKEADYSYTLGAFPTYELITARPEQVRKVVVHSGYTDVQNLEKLCHEKRIPLEYNDKLISKISDKENCYAAGIFNKYSGKLNNDRPHIVLVNPSNMGNLGTILRTAVGFGIKDIAIILPGADIFNPKTVRSSMGALFRLNFLQYQSFAEYRREFAGHEIFTFMLKGKRTLALKDCLRLSFFPWYSGKTAILYIYLLLASIRSTLTQAESLIEKVAAVVPSNINV